MSTIHLIAPSGYCINQHAAALAAERLTQQGHHITNPSVITRRSERFAGSDKERLADINALATLAGNNTIVMAVRGGYGASRLLADIDWQGIAARQQQQPLLICGHSDFTAIQLGLLATGNVITFSGPMLAGNFGADTLDAFTQEHFWRALTSPTFSIEWNGIGPQCHVEGTLWGGNLAMLTSLIGTPWLPSIPGGILVVEDINEHPYRVERMLLQLLHAGILAQQQALILGSFSHAQPNDYDAGYNLTKMVDYLRSQLTIPVISGLAFGHEPQTVTLPLGAFAQLQHTDKTLLTLTGHPVISG
ncbi:muramoyltetrapeptide carboxypeptidase [Kosakonia oryzae]|uniref:Muramoyltetrapeptide carboxypeptidase n=1 Tax=Kosakonia oryzae TaxID=497725 RepID=A0AA94KR27_9ENTR|nr:muramoyltetrapeptide carboxypeptidase [Kosakonia oryzae]ANI82603.1 muramoyltetrapeptide carboxypeptidase [Kosakonia oryzae]UDJ84519.1 muramoyltetrapeptide carboxypeptidase [Kosakonia oryzae]SFC63224.1 muramoyltetrapeptide carboxypeptidase [Kosakonia oryzae]